MGPVVAEAKDLATSSIAFVVPNFGVDLGAGPIDVTLVAVPIDVTRVTVPIDVACAVVPINVTRAAVVPVVFALVSPVSFVANLIPIRSVLTLWVCR